VAQRGVVVFAGIDHEAVVFGGQGGVDASGLAGGHEQCLPHDRITAFGRAAVSIVEAGGVEGGHEAGEGSSAGEGGEPVRVAEAPQDRPCSDMKDSRATSVRTRARSAAGSGAPTGRPAAVLTAAMRLATSRRNGLASPSKILNGAPSLAASR
jgi:hypothetical protein